MLQVTVSTSYQMNALELKTKIYVIVIHCLCPISHYKKNYLHFKSCFILWHSLCAYRFQGVISVCKVFRQILGGESLRNQNKNRRQLIKTLCC